MKVAILTPTFSHFSGIDRVAEAQAEDFVKKGHEVTVITFKSTIEPKGYEIKVIGMPEKAFWQRLYRLFFFIDTKKINEGVKLLEGYDTVVSHFYPMNLIAEKAKEKYGLKYIAFNHGIGFPHLFPNLLEKSYMQMFKHFSNGSMKKADKIYSVSKFLAKELKNETGLESMVAYNKIDKQKFHPHINGRNVRKKYGIHGEPIILFVGRLSPHKGVHLLIEAFKTIRENRGARLLIVGKPTFDDYYKRLKEMSDRYIIFAGFVDDDELPEYYAACNVYATASLWEGFDIPVVEAQACGKPVVAFDVCSHREVVKKGTLVKENDIEGFASAILRYIK